MRISSLTSYDNVMLTASFYYYYEEHFNCEEKKKKYIKRVGIDRANTIMSSENGCGVISDKLRYSIDGIEYYTCVCKFRVPEISFYLGIVDKFEKGILPYEGPLVDQPSKIIEIIDRITHMKNEITIRNQQKRESK